MNAESMMVDPNELVIDMPLDEANVKTKMESLAANGMIQDVTVWLQDMRIIDGFHRAEAARRLGWPAIRCKVVDCSEAAFWDARIQSARQHHTIEGERLNVWIRECWRSSDWPDVIAVMKDGQIRATNPNAIDAYVTNQKERCIIKPSNRFERWLVEERGLKYWYEVATITDADMGKVKGFGPARRAEIRRQQRLAESLISLDGTNPLSTMNIHGDWTSEDEALTVAIFIGSTAGGNRTETSVSLGAWFQNKAKQWGVPKEWLLESIFSEFVDKGVVLQGAKILRGIEESFTIGDATAIAKAIGVNAYYTSSDDESRMRMYLKKRDSGETWEHYRKRINDEDYLERKAKAEGIESRRRAWEESEAGKEAARKALEKQCQDTAKQSLVDAKSNVQSFGFWGANIPEAPAMLAEFAQFVADFAAEHFPGVEVARPNPVSLDNARLRAENAKLRERIASLERAFASKESAGAMIANAMAWSSGDMEK